MCKEQTAMLRHGNSVELRLQCWRKQRFTGKGSELNEKVFCGSKQGNFSATDEVLVF
jgi:hypothetical protein